MHLTKGFHMDNTEHFSFRQKHQLRLVKENQESRLVPKHRLISISIFQIPLKIDILIHNWNSKHICSIRYTYCNSICVYFICDSQEMTVFKTPKQHKKSAAEGGRLLRLFFRLLYSHFLEVQNKIYTYWVYLMEHIFLGVQLCIKASFFNEFCEFSIFLPDCH